MANERDQLSPTNDTNDASDTSPVDDDSIDDPDELAQSRGRSIDRTRPMDPASLGSIVRRSPSESEEVALARITEQLTTRESASGLAATLTAVSRLPKETQLAQIDLEAKRQDHDFELEKQRIATEAQEREAERTHERARWERSLVHHETNERRVFWFVVFLVALGVGGTVALFAVHQNEIASHVLNTLLAGGLGYQGGKSAGALKSSKQMLLHESQRDEEK